MFEIIHLFMIYFVFITINVSQVSMINEKIEQNHDIITIILIIWNEHLYIVNKLTKKKKKANEKHVLLSIVFVVCTNMFLSSLYNYDVFELYKKKYYQNNDQIIKCLIRCSRLSNIYPLYTYEIYVLNIQHS